MIDNKYDYNRAIARIKELSEQLAIKQEQWSAEEKRYALIEDKLRDLCIQILCKDSKQTRSGGKIWSKMSPIELIATTSESYSEYVNSNTQMLHKLMDINEDRRAQIDSLTEQIEIMYSNKDISFSSPEELQEFIKKSKEKEQAHLSLSNNIKEEVEKGNIEVEIEEENGEMCKEEPKIIKSTIEENNTLTKVTKNSIKVRHSNDKKTFMNNTRKTMFMTDLKKTMDSLTDYCYEIIKAVTQHS